MVDMRADLVQFARWIERSRQEREAFFPADLFGEPGWSLLLDLFIVHSEGIAVNTSGACCGAQVPQTTGLRWLDKLDAAGLIQRRPHPHDSRFVMVELSADGHERMAALLAAMRDRAPPAAAPPEPERAGRRRFRIGPHLHALRAILPAAPHRS